MIKSIKQVSLYEIGVLEKMVEDKIIKDPNILYWDHERKMKPGYQ